MSEQLQTDSDIRCAVCASNTRVPEHDCQYASLYARWGYGAAHDSEHYRLELCESCFFDALAYLRQQRRIHTMFDNDQPVDDRTFGRVEPDGLYGEF